MFATFLSTAEDLYRSVKSIRPIRSLCKILASYSLTRHGYFGMVTWPHHYAAKVTSIRLLLYYGCMQKRFYRACVITRLLFTSVEDFTTLKDTSRSAFLPRNFLPSVSLYLPSSINTKPRCTKLSFSITFLDRKTIINLLDGDCSHFEIVQK